MLRQTALIHQSPLFLNVRGDKCLMAVKKQVVLSQLATGLPGNKGNSRIFENGFYKP